MGIYLMRIYSHDQLIFCPNAYFWFSKNKGYIKNFAKS